MTDQPKCSECGAELPADAPAGLCSKCLLKMGFNPSEQSAQAPTGSFSASQKASFTLPTLDEIRAMFPQLEILSFIGRGGMGAVYKARQKSLDRMVALKIVPLEVSQLPGFAERFAREARALAQLSHPHIVAIYDFGQVNQHHFLVMEFVDGLNLRQVIQTGIPEPKTALSIIPQICEALQYAHEHGVVHRDIKPENILVGKNGRVKIADFGLAKLLNQDGIDEKLTATRQVMGTVRYMAPEQFEGLGSVDHRADIYSLGVVFYELLTGDIPQGRFPLPSEKMQIDVRLDQVVLRALEREPELRYQHASEMKTNVDEIASTKGTISKPETTNNVSSEPKLSRYALLGALLGAIGIIAMIFLLIDYNTKAPSRPLTSTSSTAEIWLYWIWTYFMRGLWWLAMLVSFSTPFFMTIFGFVAIGQIRHSKGKLYGMRLAVLDALLFPLLVLDSMMLVVAVFLVRIASSIIFNIMSASTNGKWNANLSVVHVLVVLLVFVVPIAVWLNRRIYRAVWQKATEK